MACSLLCIKETAVYAYISLSRVVATWNGGPSEPQHIRALFGPTIDDAEGTQGSKLGQTRKAPLLECSTDEPRCKRSDTYFHVNMAPDLLF
eukprot:10896388-Karenia_brevis.AAC.1